MSRVKAFAQTVLDRTLAAIQRRFPIAFWLATSRLMPSSTLEFFPAEGPLAGTALRLKVDNTIYPYVMAKGHWQIAEVTRLLSESGGERIGGPIE